MARALSHRDRGIRECRTFDDATAGFLGRHAGSIAKDAASLVVVVGEVFQVPGQARTPAERVLSAYREGGVNALVDVGGAFSAVIVDFATKGAPAQLTLFRDGTGARPLYWGQHRGRLFFAVEPKALLATEGFPRRLRMDAVAQYLSYSFQPGQGTMLDDVFELGLGTAAVFRLDAHGGRIGAPIVEDLFRFEDEPREDASDDEWIARTHNTVRQAIAQRLPTSDTPLGIFLSGGLDSSIVTAEAQRQRREHGFSPAKTYAIHFGEGYANELSFAQEAAAAAGTQHEEVCVKPSDFVPRLREIIAQLDDPIGDPITIPNYELARRAAADVDVVFNGEGGDPLFGGPKNLSMMLHQWYGLDAHPFAQERAYLRAYRRAYEDRRELMTPQAWSLVDEHQALEAPLHAFFSASAPDTLLNKLMAINVRLKGASLILPKVDRMLSAHGIAVRAPLFDANLLRLSFAMPPRIKLRGVVEKWALKRAFEDIVPAGIIARPKSGMRVPVHFWFQGELRRYAKKIFSPKEVARVGIFSPAYVKRLLAYDLDDGRGRYGIKLWMLLTFERWRRHVFDHDVL